MTDSASMAETAMAASVEFLEILQLRTMYAVVTGMTQQNLTSSRSFCHVESLKASAHVSFRSPLAGESLESNRHLATISLTDIASK